MLQKILLAIGDSPDSAQILESGLTLAEKLGAEILILHVLDPLVPHGLSAVQSPLVGGVLPIVNDRAIMAEQTIVGAVAPAIDRSSVDHRWIDRSQTQLGGDCRAIIEPPVKQDQIARRRPSRLPVAPLWRRA